MNNRLPDRQVQQQLNPPFGLHFQFKCWLIGKNIQNLVCTNIDISRRGGGDKTGKQSSILMRHFAQYNWWLHNPSHVKPIVIFVTVAVTLLVSVCCHKHRLYQSVRNFNAHYVLVSPSSWNWRAILWSTEHSIHSQLRGAANCSSLWIPKLLPVYTEDIALPYSRLASQLN